MYVLIKYTTDYVSNFDTYLMYPHKYLTLIWCYQ